MDAKGQSRLSLTGGSQSLHSEAREALATGLQEQKCVLTDLHAGPGDLPPHMDIIVPIFASEGWNEPVGAMVEQIDAKRFLYPLIDFWPTPSQSAETLLVRRDGDSVLFLNDLRHQKETALKLLIPLSQEEVPAVMAVAGKEGLVEGKDYRGIEVLSVLKAIPDSPWYMVAKIDKKEILANWRSLSLVILGLILGLAAALAAAMGMAWQYFAKAHYRELFQSEAALRKSEARYATTLMSIGDGVITTGRDGLVEMMNPVAEVLTGWRKEEAHGKTSSEVFHIVSQETLHPAENPVERVLRQDMVIFPANHTLLIARDGKEYPIAVSAAPIRSKEGEITGVVLVFRDQSEQRRAEEALQKAHDELELRVKERTAELEFRNKELQDFVFIASHDLQEPLRKIQTFGDLLARRCMGSLDEISRDYLGRMQNSALRMLNLLHSLLDYSRVTSKFEPMKETDLRKSVELALANLEIVVKEKNARVEIGELPAITADPVQMLQLFQNLIGNALKYQRQGEAPYLKVYARLRDENGAYEIRVEDKGIGFENKYAEKIFLPFQRLHARNEHEGVGMGLAICRKIVERHGGKITAEGELGKGARFIVTLPLKHDARG